MLLTVEQKFLNILFFKFRHGGVALIVQNINHPLLEIRFVIVNSRRAEVTDAHISLISIPVFAPANKIGVCDQDYRGEYIVALHNHSNIPQMITHGDRIAQMAVVPFWQADFEEVFELDETERGAGGFGSTGKQ